jgi:hypothetical protein
LEHGISRFFTLDRAPDDSRDRVLAGQREIHLGSTLLKGTLLFLLFVALNLIPSLVSFCQTRLLVGLVARWRCPGGTVLVDGLLTIFVTFGIFYGSMRLGWLPPTEKDSFLLTMQEGSTVIETLTMKPYVRRVQVRAVRTVFEPSGDIPLVAPSGGAGGAAASAASGPSELSRHVRPDDNLLSWGLPPGIVFYSGFAASALLWLFLLGWLVARIRARPSESGESSDPRLEHPFRFVGANVVWVTTLALVVGMLSLL